jgi:hypothetical protein
MRHYDIIATYNLTEIHLRMTGFLGDDYHL